MAESGYGDVVIKSNSKFLKIEAGDPRDLRILDSGPTESFKHSTNAGPVACVGSEKCFKCQGGDTPMQKFITNVFDYKTNRVLLWEYGGGVAKQLKVIAKTLEEENREILDVDLKVDVTGSGKDKRYIVTPRMSAKALPENLVLHKIGATDLPF